MAFERNPQRWFRGKRGPTVLFKLVALRRIHAVPPEGKYATTGTSASTSTEEETGISIIGLRSEDEIRASHKAFSTTAIRDLYSPLRLCYDTGDIRRLARVVVEDYGYNFLHVLHSLEGTICGVRIATTRAPDRIRWISTLGGIMEVDGKMFAITASHMPDNIENKLPG